MQDNAIMELFDPTLRNKPFSGNEEYLTFLITAFEITLFDFLEGSKPAEENPYGSQRLLALSRLEFRLGQRAHDILKLKSEDVNRRTQVRDFITARAMRTKNLSFNLLCNKMELDSFSIFCLIGAVYLFLEPESRIISEAVSGKNSSAFTVESMARVYMQEDFSPIKSYSIMSRAIKSLLPLLQIDCPQAVSSAAISADKGLVDHLLESSSANSFLCETGEYFKWDSPLPKLLSNSHAVEEIINATLPTHALIVITGRVCSGKRFVLRNAAQKLQLYGYIIDARRFFSSDAISRKNNIWQLEREASLNKIFCMLTNIDEISEEIDKSELQAALSSLQNKLYMLCLSSNKEDYVYDNDGEFFTHIHIPIPNATERYQLFCDFAVKTEYEEEMPLHEFANKYRFTLGQIKQAVENAEALANLNESKITGAELQQSCSSLINNGLGNRASLIKTTFELDDVILPPAQKRQLLFACGQIRNQHIVYDDWGYGKHISYGRGTSLLLYGPPGTGKTMAAGAIANRLGLELYRVDISKIVDKYIGETEKNIGEIFDRAKQCSVVLFFDEADALFSKRSEVGSSNDRHANMETGFLLQCVEDYDGISILATNYKQNIDPAFLRRIKFTVEFPAPQADIRRTLWIKSFPKESPLDKTVDFDFLSERFELSGGNIKNIAVNSAFYAAEHGSMIGMEAIVNCIYAELQKNHMVTDSSYFAQYSTFLQL